MTLQELTDELGFDLKEVANDPFEYKELKQLRKYKLTFEYEEEQGNNTQVVKDDVKSIKINNWNNEIIFQNR